ncbi:MAG: zf-HC2 domain-containing protein [Spirochaetaceae bacterium]|jgi:hypothetical protein|nr:zf-HC2 domain-containing protein [Spirochaetaceae bacterium]
MSTCPENDIHHGYLDGELPEGLAVSYTRHMEGCPRCKKKAAALSAVRAALREDSQSLSLSQAELDAGYERLIDRMRYHRVCSAIGAKKIPMAVTRVLPWVAVLAILVGGAYSFLHRPNERQGQFFWAALPFSGPGLYEDALVTGATPKAPRRASFSFSNIDVFKPSFLPSPVLHQRKKTLWQHLPWGLKIVGSAE